MMQFVTTQTENKGIHNISDKNKTFIFTIVY
jgi:hypothetical protein